MEQANARLDQAEAERNAWREQYDDFLAERDALHIELEEWKKKWDQERRVIFHLEAKLTEAEAGLRRMTALYQGINRQWADKNREWKNEKKNAESAEAKLDRIREYVEKLGGFNIIRDDLLSLLTEDDE